MKDVGLWVKNERCRIMSEAWKMNDYKWIIKDVGLWVKNKGLSVFGYYPFDMRGCYGIVGINCPPLYI